MVMPSFASSFCTDSCIDEFIPDGEIISPQLKNTYNFLSSKLYFKGFISISVVTDTKEGAKYGVPVKESLCQFFFNDDERVFLAVKGRGDLNEEISQ